MHPTAIKGSIKFLLVDTYLYGIWPEVLRQLEQEGYKINPADVAKLSPLIHEHFNFLGRYNFRLEGPPAEGKLRPLRKPGEQQLLVA